MAVIGRIRKRVGLLIAFVGVSMLLFILGDLVTSNKGLMGNTSDIIGVINGEKIRYQEFEKKVDVLVENYKTNSKTDNVDQSTTDMLREQQWSMVVSENTLGKQYEKVGVTCGPPELYDYVTSRDPHPQIKQAFTDPKTGMYDPQNVVRFLKELPNRDEATQKQWATFENALLQERIMEKYKNLIKGGFYVTTQEAKNTYLETNRQAAIRYMELAYSGVPDSSIKPEESDLKSYYNEHKNEYKQLETIRKVEYITFDINPSGDDQKEVSNWAIAKQSEFAQSTNDTLFVNQNSDTPFDTTFHAKGTLSPILDTTLFTASVGTIIGPYQDRGSYKISKLVGTREIPDSVKVSHALIAYKGAERANPSVTRSRDEAKVRADSLFKLAQKDTKKFLEIAKSGSDDIVSAMKEGDLGWLNKSSGMDDKFKAGYLSTPKGNVTLVESPFGFHLIKIFDASKGRSKEIIVATVERKVEPSQKTYDFLYNKANQFAAANNTPQLFDSAIVKENLNKRIADNLKENDRTIPGLDQPRELIRWAFKAKKGEISKTFTLGDKYVIAHLTAIREKGIIPLEDVKPQITSAVIKEKKAEMLIEKINKQAAGATTIDAIAQKLNVLVPETENLNMSSTFIPNVGNEPRVTGTVFAMKQGQLSKPIKGDNGVFVVFVKSFTEPVAMKDYEMNRQQILEQRKGRSEYEVFNALKEKANIEDNRGKFY